MENIRTGYDEYHERGFEVIGVNLDHERAALDTFLAREHGKFPWLVLWELWKKKLDYDRDGRIHLDTAEKARPRWTFAMEFFRFHSSFLIDEEGASDLD